MGRAARENAASGFARLAAAEAEVERAARAYRVEAARPREERNPARLVELYRELREAVSTAVYGRARK